MATYGYSTPYTGMRQPTLPPGYMEAATAPGRNLAAGIAQFGAGIGQAIQRYQDNKAQNEAAIQTFETLTGMAQQALASDPSYQALQNYYETGQLPPGVTEADLQRFGKKVEADRSMLNRMVGLGEKFGDMSVAKKKAAIGDMAMVLQQYQQRGEADMKREINQLALDKARREAATTRNIDELMRYGFGLPQDRTVTEPQVTIGQETLYPVGPMPANWPEQMISEPKGPYVQRAQEPAIQSTGIPVGGLDRFAEIGSRFRQNQQVQPAPAAPQPVPVREPEFMAPIQAQTQNLEMVQTKKAVPYDELRQGLAQFATERGMGAEAFGAIDKILEARGLQKPLKVESQQLPGGAMVIRADNKIEILPPAKPIEGKDLTESQALSAGFAARMAYNNKVIDDTIKAGYTPKTLTEFGWIPDRFKTQSRKSYESAKNNWIAAQLRKESGAAIGPQEYEQADLQYFPQPGDSNDVIQQKAELRKVAERTMKAAVGRNSDFYIQQILGGAQEAQFPQGSGVYRLVRGKEIQPVQ